MVSAILARRAMPLLARSTRGARSMHVENTHETCMPFPQGPKNRVGLAIGITSFLSFGFALPFIAARFQLKSGA